MRILSWLLVRAACAMADPTCSQVPRAEPWPSRAVDMIARSIQERVIGSPPGEDSGSKALSITELDVAASLSMCIRMPIEAKPGARTGLVHDQGLAGPRRSPRPCGDRGRRQDTGLVLA